MGRSRRLHLPGAPFHLTARTQGKTPLFVGLESTVARLIREQVDRGSGQLLAYAVMPNHLHVVYVQGDRPLAHFMQPLLRRLALRVHARERTEGHVFERRFHASACRDPDYLRNVILYVHLNPVRAKLCQAADDYAFTTHQDYCARDASASAWDGTPGSGLDLFSPDVGCAHAQVRDNYWAFLEWRLHTDAANLAREGACDVFYPSSPRYKGGDQYWIERFGAHCPSRSEAPSVGVARLDLRDLARRTLCDVEPAMPLDFLRSGRRTKPLVAVRRHFILRAKRNGHRNSAIARFLNIDDATVSRTH